jgi:hypothetical protein
VKGLVRAEGETTEREDHGSCQTEPFGRTGNDCPQHHNGGDDGQICPGHIAPAESLHRRVRSTLNVIVIVEETMRSTGMGWVTLLTTRVTAVGIAQSYRRRVRSGSPDDMFDRLLTPDFRRSSRAVPEGAPDVLRIVLDDIGFSASSTFGGPVAAHMPDLTQMISGCAPC